MKGNYEKSGVVLCGEHKAQSRAKGERSSSFAKIARFLKTA